MNATFQRRSLAFLLITTLAIALYAMMLLPQRPYLGIVVSVNGEISTLDSQGPAAQAGIQLSDLILAIDGESLKMRHSFYPDLQIGDSVTYTVKRGIQTFNFTVSTALIPPYALANRLVLLSLGTIFWLFGLILYIRNYPTIGTSHFIIFAVSGSVALFALEDAERGYIWGRYAMYLSLPVNGAAFLNIHREFPKTVSSWWRNLCDLSYGFSIVIFVGTLWLGPHTFSQIVANHGLSSQLPSNIIRLVWAIECLAGLFLLVQGYRVQSGDARRRVRFITIGSLIGLIPTAVIMIGEVVSFFAIPNTIALLGLLALPTTYAISLTRSDIIQLETRVYKTLVGATLVVTIPLIYLGVLFAIGWFNPSMSSSPITGALLALSLTLTYSRIQREIEHLFQRIFFGEKSDHTKQLTLLTQSLKTLSSALDEATVIDLLTKQIPSEIGVSVTGLWFVENNAFVWKGGQLKGLDSYSEQLLEDKLRLPNSVLLKPRLIQKGDSPYEEQIRWWIPLTTSSTTNKTPDLHGIWLLGPRQNDESFSPSDIEIITVATQENALAIKAIRLVAELRLQLQQTELAWRRTIQIREEEQERIANDLHDDVIQLVFSCGLNAQKAIQIHQSGKSPIQALNQLRQLLDDVNRKTRAICYNLRPDTLSNLDLIEMLEYLVEDINSKNSQVTVILQKTQKHKFHLESLNQHVKVNLFRIVQESVTNAIKHANASHIVISATSDESKLTVGITDDGLGFDPKKVSTKKQSGMGLVTMQARALDIHADLKINSSLGAGAYIFVTLPITQTLSAECGISSNEQFEEGCLESVL